MLSPTVGGAQIFWGRTKIMIFRLLSPTVGESREDFPTSEFQMSGSVRIHQANRRSEQNLLSKTILFPGSSIGLLLVILGAGPVYDSTLQKPLLPATPSALFSAEKPLLPFSEPLLPLFQKKTLIFNVLNIILVTFTAFKISQPPQQVRVIFISELEIF